MTDLRPLTGIAQIEPRNRDAWIAAVAAHGIAPVADACRRCGTPARLPDVLADLPPATAIPQDQPMPPESEPSPADLLRAEIKQAMAKRNATGAAVAAAIGVSHATVNSYLRGAVIRPAIIDRLIDWLRSPPADQPADPDAAPATPPPAAAKAKAHRAPWGLRTTPPDAARKAVAAAAAALGVRPVTVYLVQGGKLVEALAIPLDGAA